MSPAFRWHSLWRRLSSRRQMKADIEAEIAFHIEGRVDEMVAEGMTSEEAHRRARDLARLDRPARLCDDLRVALGALAQAPPREDLRGSASAPAFSRGDVPHVLAAMLGQGCRQ